MSVSPVHKKNTKNTNDYANLRDQAEKQTKIHNQLKNVSIIQNLKQEIK
jgi:hypothetical protein